MRPLNFVLILAVVFGLAGCFGGNTRLSSSHKRTPKRIPARRPVQKNRVPNSATELPPEQSLAGTYLGTESGDPQKLLLKDDSGSTKKFLCVEGCPVFEAGENPVGKPMRVYWRKEKEQSVLYGVELL